MPFQTMKQKSKSAIKQLQIALSARYAEDVMNGIYNSLSQASNSLKQSLADKMPDINIANDSDLFEETSDTAFLYKRTAKLACEMRIIAFYKAIEISIEDMLNFCGLFNKDELKLLYKHKELKKLFKQTIGDIETILGYQAYNELRNIHDCILHSGRVDKELAQFSGWKEDKKLKPEKLEDAYWRLKPDVDIFLCEVKGKLIKKIR
jgi:hypothetical protein